MDIGNLILQGLRLIGALLCNLIYSLISGFYQLFMTVSKINILSSDEIAPIYQRVTMILTIVMVFYITFEFVKYVIQPDTFTDKEKGVGNIVQRMIVSVVLIAFVPTIFSYAYKIQNRIIDNQIFSKIILGKADADFGTMGNKFSADMLSLFYSPNEEICNGNNCQEINKIVTDNLENLKNTGNVNISKKITETEKDSGEKVFLIKFNGVLAIAVGFAILWILLMYTIDVGTRYAQLIFLQIMSPIAIISYISPKKDSMFSKWTKQCITTYLDLFIRLAIIYFVLLIIGLLGKSFLDPNRLFAGMTTTPMIRTMTYVAVVMGLLMFAQKAPKMLGELLPGGGSASIGYGFGAKGRLEPTKKAFAGSYKHATGTLGMARRTTGAVGGAIAGALAQKGFGGRFRGAVAGAKAGSDKKTKGFLEGSTYRRVQKAYAAGGKSRQEDEEILANVPSKHYERDEQGNIVYDQNGQPKFKELSREYRLRQARMHSDKWANEVKELNRQLVLYDVPKKGMDSISAQVDEFKQVKALKQELESAKSRGASAAEVKTLDAKYKAACQTIRTEIVKAGGNFETVKQKADAGNITFTWKKLDENGFAIPGAQEEKLNLRLDEGDSAFANPLYTIEQGEIEKLKELQSLEAFKNIEVDVTKPDGSKKKLYELTPEEYIKNIHKVKDAMVGPKTAFENSEKFVEAKEYSKGAGGSGK